MTDVGNLTSLSDCEVNLSPEDDTLISVERSSTKHHNISSSDAEEFFHDSLSSDDGKTMDDSFYRMFSDDGTSLDVEDTFDEDTDFHVDDHTKCRQSQVAPRKLCWLNQHPYAPLGSPVSPGEPINHCVFG